MADKTLKEVCKETLLARINGDKQHGWGTQDQLEIVMTAIAHDCGGERKDYVDGELETIIREQLNGSAFRQRLVAAKLLDETVKTAKAKTGLLA